ncbi:hypothetical protein JOD54_002439 [Actinokineospora baliensis]|uniref:hypothetical protein n=1 Tax=Actinokineospora baliensis TaxID=547056 RepID=UPI00195E7854|nr:hypothetical protein [Actinokineospora baliensis]MBM7772235.1 hypothetical protein [Actinokineospora baliensis]
MGEQELADRETFWRWAEVVIAVSFPLAFIAFLGLVFDFRLPEGLNYATLLAGVVFGLAINAYLVGEGAKAVRRPGSGPAGGVSPVVGMGLVVAFYLFCLVNLINLFLDEDLAALVVIQSCIGVVFGLGFPTYVVLRLIGGRGATN